MPLSTHLLAVSAFASGAYTFGRTLFAHVTGGTSEDRRRREGNKDARGELLYDEAFSIAKSILERISMFTVEDTQRFGNNFTPAPYFVRVVRVVIPESTRIAASKLFIGTIGEREIYDVIGGPSWWQRTAHKHGGIDGEWISMKRDFPAFENEESDDMERLRAMKKEAKERARRRRREVRRAEQEWEDEQRKEERKEKRRRRDNSEEAVELSDSDTDSVESGASVPDTEEYVKEMDEQRCILFVHGGGYFSCSTNTHRYALWRIARKTNSRVFSVDYRLAPQYPFPCGLVDALSAYVYLTDPPPDAKHGAVDPKRLTIAGDSAGGGICLALLCLLRDAGRPLPAGAILVSPWCDLTHSFPSILTNTGTDIIPPAGFLFRPSTLWPPPPIEFQIRANREVSHDKLERASRSSLRSKHSTGTPPTHGSTSTGPLAAATKRVATELADKGGPDALKKADKVQLDGTERREDEEERNKAEAAQTMRLTVDGKEIELRDQIQLYATNAQLAYPFVSPVWQPSLGGLPPMYVLAGDGEVLRDEIIYMAHRAAHPEQYPLRKPLLDFNPERTRKAETYPPTQVHLQVYDNVCHDIILFSFTNPAKYAFRSIASFVKWVLGDAAPLREAPLLGSSESQTLTEEPEQLASPSASNQDAASSKRSSSFLPTRKSRAQDDATHTSADPLKRPPFVDNMIRERVSVHGVVRPLEPAEEIHTLQMDPNELGLIKEEPVKRYLAGIAIAQKKFKRAYKRVNKHRERNLRKSVKEEAKRLRHRLQETERLMNDGKLPRAPILRELDGEQRESFVDSPRAMVEHEEGIWELRGERPPPSSIAARKDTSEARRLAHSLDEKHSRVNALALWAKAQESKFAGADRPPPLSTVSEEKPVANSTLS